MASRKGNKQFLARLLLSFLALLFFCGCSQHDILPSSVTLSPPLGPSPLKRYAPYFYLQDSGYNYNRIGQVRASGHQQAEQIRIDADHAVLYSSIMSFDTAKGHYTNLIFRVHFPGVPFSLVPFHLAAGRHVGLLVIVTLDARQQPVLLTTAHTCGCYAISIPTTALDPAMYPKNWPETSFSLYGERLPALLPTPREQQSFLIMVRPDIHRIMDIVVIDRDTLPPGPVVPASMMELQQLKQLQRDDGTTTSFYYDTWPLKGHVKGAFKPWETLLLGLVSLDFYVGMDKEYNPGATHGNPFYTSLKPWNRTASDLNNFAGYLHFNGWGL